MPKNISLSIKPHCSLSSQMQITSIQTRTRSVNYIKNPRIPSVNQMNLLFLKEINQKKRVRYEPPTTHTLFLFLSLWTLVLFQRKLVGKRERERVCYWLKVKWFKKRVCLGLRKLWGKRCAEKKEKGIDFVRERVSNPFSVSMWKCKRLTWPSFVFS